MGTNGVAGVGLTNSNHLYVKQPPRQLAFEIHSRREWNTGLCTSNIAESVTVMPVTLIGPKPSTAVLPLELVEREWMLATRCPRRKLGLSRIAFEPRPKLEQASAEARTSPFRRSDH